MNTLVVRTELSGNPSFKEVLGRVRQVMLDAYQNQDVPFEKLVEELQPGRDLSRSPLFQVMLVLQNAERQELQMPGLRLSGIGIESRVAKFDLQFTLSESVEGLGGEVSYALDLYEAGTVERMEEHLRMVLGQMVGEPEQKIGDWSLLTEAEREQVVVGFPSTRRWGRNLGHGQPSNSAAGFSPADACARYGSGGTTFLVAPPPDASRRVRLRCGDRLHGFGRLAHEVKSARRR